MIINLTIASLSPFLRDYVADIEVLEKVAVEILGRWAIKHSSIEVMWKIAVALSDKRQLVA